MKKILLLLFICLLQTASFAQIDPGFLRLNAAQKRWVDSTFSTLSQNEKIGQLVMVAAFSDPRRALIDTTFSNPRYVAKLIEDYKIGGVVFFQTRAQRFRPLEPLRRSGAPKWQYPPRRYGAGSQVVGVLYPN